MADLNLWLDSYDDIFSDFDSRHYQRRRISEDFLYELRRETRYTGHPSGSIVLLLPVERRDAAAEALIAASLSNFFAKRFLFHRNRCRTKLRKGIILLLSGMLIMLANAWINYTLAVSFASSSLKVLLEPAGWFLIWASFDFLFYDYSELKKEREFYRLLAKMKLDFKSG